MVSNVLRVIGDDRSSARDLAYFIGKDQAITNKVLRLANSAYYGRLGKVDSITRAISILGFNEVTSLTLGVGVFTALQQRAASGLLNMRDLWLHSIGSSFAARTIHDRTTREKGRQVGLWPKRDMDESPVFLGGLLHDMGKVIFSIFFPDEYGVVLEEAKTSEAFFFQTEQELLGVDHCQMAGMLMRTWHFPDTIRTPVRHHHSVESCPDGFQKDAAIIELADNIVHRLRIGASGSCAVKNPRWGIRQLGFTGQDLVEIAQEVQEQRSEVERFLALME